MARPSKLDDLTAQRVINAVAKGLPRDTAAKLAGVVPSTLFLWLKKGRDGNADYSEFSDRVRAAEAASEETLVAQMFVHTKSSWQATAWMLERRRWKQWGPRKHEAVEAPRPGVTPASSEETLAILESLMAATRSAAG